MTDRIGEKMRAEETHWNLTGLDLKKVEEPIRHSI